MFPTPTLYRHDFLKQMYRYMVIAYQDNGLATYGKRMTIDLVDGVVSAKIFFTPNPHPTPHAHTVVR